MEREREREREDRKREKGGRESAPVRVSGPLRFARYIVYNPPRTRSMKATVVLDEILRHYVKVSLSLSLSLFPFVVPATPAGNARSVAVA